MEYAAIRHFADRRYCCAVGKGRFLVRLEPKKGDASGNSLRLRTQRGMWPITAITISMRSALPA